jgi:hypothetical protein
MKSPSDLQDGSILNAEPIHDIPAQGLQLLP